MNIDLSLHERKQIIFWIDGRLPQARATLTEHYTNDFLSHLTGDDVLTIHSERRIEIAQLNALRSKLSKGVPSL